MISLETLISKTLANLATRLNNEPIFSVQNYNGEVMEATCKLYSPPQAEEILEFENETGLLIPKDFKEFLVQHNGAELFAHPEYGGGINIMNISHMMDLYESYREMIPTAWYPIGFDDVGFLWINSEEVTENTRDCQYLYWSSLIDINEERTALNSNFEIWLERLITAEGKKFWE